MATSYCWAFHFYKFASPVLYSAVSVDRNVRLLMSNNSNSFFDKYFQKNKITKKKREQCHWKEISFFSKYIYNWKYEAFIILTPFSQFNYIGRKTSFRLQYNNIYTNADIWVNVKWNIFKTFDVATFYNFVEDKYIVPFFFSISQELGLTQYKKMFRRFI